MTLRTWYFAKIAAFTAFPALPLLAPVGYYAGCPWLTALLLFIAVPLLDWIIGPDQSRPPRTGVPQMILIWLRTIPRVYVFAWLGTMAWGSALLAHDSVAGSAAGWLFLALAANSAFAACVAHELLHWRSAFDRGLARLIMAAIAYGPFPIEHLHHHRNIGIVYAGTTPPLGQSVWTFVAQNVLFTLRDAWQIERRRQISQGLGLLHNRCIQQWAFTIGLAALFMVIAGAWGLVLFFVQAAAGIFASEFVNYAQHYGLTRNADASPRGSLSWSSNGFLTNAFTLNITRHADHHLRPDVPYFELEHIDAMPLLPSGYLALFFPAMIPALWRCIMDRRAQNFAVQ